MADLVGTSSKPAPTPRIASSVHDIAAEKPPFGARFLTNDADVWSQNAWDHVPPPEDQDEIISAALTKQRLAPVPDEKKNKYNEKPAKHWDNFYKMNAGNFFRNRKWLHIEFPELSQAAVKEAGHMTIVEVGCGAGNAVFPLLASNQNPHLSLRAYDYASHAVKVVQNNPLYIDPPIGNIKAAVWDLSSSSLPPEVEPISVDIVIMIFVLSALHPHEWRQAIANVHQILKPGGLVLFRDYGRYDLTQLRFKGGRLLDDNFYIRGDKTRVYFFELDELALLFTGSSVPSTFQTSNTESVEEEDAPSGATQDEASATHVPSPVAASTPVPASSPASEDTSPKEAESSTSKTRLTPEIHPCLLDERNHRDNAPHPLFAIEQLGVDRRLIVNRKRQLKMYRVWMQGKFRKL